MINELFDVYLAEMREHLEVLDESLLKLDKAYDDKNIINTIFRAFHTMKGSTATMGYNRTAEVIHIMEDLLQEIRDGKIRVDSNMIQILFQCHDIIEKYVEILSNTREESFDNPGFIEALRKYSEKNFQAQNAEKSARQEVQKMQANISVSHIELDYIKGKISMGFKPYTVYMRIAADCQFKAIRAWMAFNELEQESEIICANPVKPKKEDFSDSSFVFEGNEIKALIISEKTNDEIYKDLYSILMEIEEIKVEDYVIDEDGTSRVVNDIIESDSSSGALNEKAIPFSEDTQVSGEGKFKLPEITEEKYILYQNGANELPSMNNKNNQDIKSEQLPGKEENSAPKKSGNPSEPESDSRMEQKSQSFIRIPEQKVDSLVDMLGELLIIQSLHRQEINDMISESDKIGNKLSNTILRMERITKDVQTISMSLRMVSLKQTFQKLLRIGRDTAIELNKNINFTLSGENTEIDRSVVEKIQDPLMHLLRNAVSHGIEPENDRIAKGKPAQGQVGINAYNKRGFAFIEVSDDGKGMVIEKIYKKAKEKNLIDLNKAYTDEEIIRFIFLPGFSTEENINNVSGRGVGMNVVETEIQKIGGRMEIINRPESGCTIVLKIPINLATINGTVVDIFNERYILPTLHIKQLLKPEASQWISIKGKTDMIKIRDEVIQVVHVENVLGIKDSKADYREGMIIVVELEHKVRALPVKAVIGKQEIVVKPLGPDFRSLDFASGATILGDGRVALILDIEALF